MFIPVLGGLVLLIIFLQARIYAKFWDRHLTTAFRFSGKEAFVGDALVLHAEVANRKILPLPWLAMEYELSEHLRFDEEVEIGASIKQSVFSVMGYRRVRRKMRFTCTRRGVYRLRRIKLSASNLLHTQTFVKQVLCTAELTVFPKLLDQYEDLSFIINHVDAMLTVRALINPDPFTFRGLREYTTHDPLRNINFKATAVAGELMVNIYAPTSSKQLEIILDLAHPPGYTNDDVFEHAISLAATLAQKYLSDEVQVGLMTNGRDVLIGAQPRLHCGEGPAQLLAIYHALSRLGIAFRPASITAMLAELHDVSKVYAIVSINQNEELSAAVMQMKARGLEAVVIPC